MQRLNKFIASSGFCSRRKADEYIENGDVIVKLDSDDTLRLLPGKYYYEIKLNLYNNGVYEVNTIIP